MSCVPLFLPHNSACTASILPKICAGHKYASSFKCLLPASDVQLSARPALQCTAVLALTQETDIKQEQTQLNCSDTLVEQLQH
jgi:hypothetical protein